jgi:hypothetical protein
MALVLEGKVVPLAPGHPESFKGRVYVGDDGRIAGIRTLGGRAPGGFKDVPVVDTDGCIYPGLIDLHSHIAFNTIPLWVDKDHVGPWAHHDSWTGAHSYHPDVVWPCAVLGTAAGAALLAYVSLKAAIGGTTAIQGSVMKPKLGDPWIVRVVENETLGTTEDFVRALTISTRDPDVLKDYVKGMGDGQAFIYHCAEGQPDTVVTAEYDVLARKRGLLERLIAVHCTALGRADFDRWTAKAGTVVWSPFSNLWLYGMTTDVVSAKRAGLRIALGSDWAPSGSKNLLGELKVADIYNRRKLDGYFSDRQLVEMVTANPGDALATAWPVQAGRLVNGGLADLAVVTNRNTKNVWRNLIDATELDVQLVIVNGVARYGTKDLMEATATTPMGPVTVRGESRRVSIPQRDDPTRHWPISQIRSELNAVRRDPGGSVERSRAAIDAWAVATGDPFIEGPFTDPPLVLVPDIPTGDTMLGGLPPDPENTKIPTLDSLWHDDRFFDRVKAHKVHGGLLDGMRAYYPKGS